MARAATGRGGTEHKITLHATETVLRSRCEPGDGTFNNGFPLLFGNVGDIFDPGQRGKVGHSLDFHASQTAMDKNMATIAPGESRSGLTRALRHLDVPPWNRSGAPPIGSIMARW